MKYYSEITKDVYETVDALEEAEAKKKEELAAFEKEKAEKKRRAEEVSAAFAEVKEAQTKANKLLDDFCKDYGAYHTTIRNPEEMLRFPSLMDFFFRM